MTAGQNVGKQLPFLRRYARAISGSQKRGDAFVKATLEAAVADAALLQKSGNVRLDLYVLFHELWSSSGVHSLESLDDQSDLLATVESRLHKITPAARQALLLATLEEFDPSEIACILQVPASDVTSMISTAIQDIEAESATDVLIIEDEPLISMQLEQLVQSLGHRISGTASTREEAAACVRAHKPGLVLADIQLADGSSGIDAVKDIISDYSVPVIFITAFPERLLTGERPEPTFLITKPFREDAVKAAISQAMFMGSTHQKLQAA